MHRKAVKWTRIMAIAAVLAAPAIGACGGSDDQTVEAIPATEMTRRQKDSLIATMPIPGSGGVGKALGILEASQVRKQEHDTIHE